MNGKYKVLILGAGGYLGSKFSAFISSKNYVVYGTFNNSAPESKRDRDLFQEVFIGSLLDEANWVQLSKHKYDYIVNMISLDYRESETQKFEIVQGVNMNIIQKIFHYLDLSQCKKIINLSSVQVYGAHEGEPFKETDKTNPSNLYGLTHAFKEQMLNYYSAQYNIRIVNLRLSNVYGPSRALNNSFRKLVCNDFCLNAVKNKRIEILSDGTPFKDFIYIDDVLSALEHYLKLNDHLTLTVNLVSSRSITLMKLAEIIKETSKLKLGEDVQILAKKRIRSFDYNLEISQYDNHSLTKTGFELKYDLAVGIEDFLSQLDKRIQEGSFPQ